MNLFRFMKTVLILGLLAGFSHSDDLPRLAIMPPTGFGVDSDQLYMLNRSLQLAASQAGYFHVLSPDENLLLLSESGLRREPRCLAESCFLDIAALLKADIILGTHLLPTDTAWQVEFRLFGREEGREIQRSLFISKLDSAQEALRLSRSAVLDLFGYSSGDTTTLAKAVTAPPSRTWHLPVSLGITTAAALFFANKNGQLKGSDNNNHPFGLPVTEQNLPLSGLRGLFASRSPAPRYRAMGGAGLALVDGAFAPLMNPAGLASSSRSEGVFSKTKLPGNVPQIYAAYASPVSRNLFQAHGLLFEGDDLASEFTFFSSFATDLALFTHFINSLKVGISIKGYLASFGKGGEGTDRSTGYSEGVGLDFGMLWSVTPRLRFGAYLRDLLNIVNHHNTLRNASYREDLPPLLSFGSSYEVSRSLLLVLDGRKALYGDQTDQVNMGFEKTVFQILKLRGGMFQIMTGETTQTWNAGLGIRHKQGAVILSADYSYEFGFENADYLSGGQVLGLNLAF